MPPQMSDGGSRQNDSVLAPPCQRDSSVTCGAGEFRPRSSVLGSTVNALPNLKQAVILSSFTPLGEKVIPAFSPESRSRRDLRFLSGR